MDTTNTTPPRKRATRTGNAGATKTGTARASQARATTAKSTSDVARRDSAKRDDSLVARTGRTIRDRPYTSAAIATGAVTVVAAAAAAGAFLVSRRDKSFKEATGELSDKVKGGFASASDVVKGGITGASDAIKDVAERGAGYFKGSDDSETGQDTRTQQEIAEEALTLKEIGAAKSPIDEVSATEIKTGAIAY